MVTKRKTSRVASYVRWAYRDDFSQYVRYRSRNGTHAEDALGIVVKAAFKEVANSDATILDLGCGFDPTMAKIPHGHYIGLDLSHQLMKQHPLYGTADAEFHRADIRYCGFQRFSYDAVNGTLVLNYLRNPAAILRKLRRRDVAFCFSVPNPEFDRTFAEYYDNATVALVLNGRHFVYYSHSVDDLRQALGNVRTLKTAYTSVSGVAGPPMYVCLYGSW